MIRFLILFILILAPLTAAGPALAQDPEAGQSGLPVPRFVTLAAGEARLRAGPGRDYPVKWLYVRRTLPVEVIDEWGIYRKVRDPDGEEGWMNQALLSGARYGMVVGKLANVRARPETAAPIVWHAEPGVIARVQVCSAGWCRIQADGRAGYVQTLDLWGVYPNEEIE